MLKIMARVIVPSLIVLEFSGCGSKPIYIQKTCDMERPVRQTPKEAICAGIKNTKEREVCTSTKYISLEKDWDDREAYIDACIK